MNKQNKKYLTIALILAVIIALGSGLFNLTVMSVSSLNIDPQGYEDPSSHEWRGSFWSIVMVTDFTDQIAGFHLASNDGDPSETYAESLGGSTYAQSYTVQGNELVPTADVMVHITPQQPYYERPLEIQQGYYVKEAWGRSFSLMGNPRTSDHADAVQFIHYSFGSGNWVLHTPFKVDVYKDGALIGTQQIDTVGGTGIYRIPASGEEFINIIDLGKINTGYGEPQWDDILYFSNNHVFVRSPTADNLLKYDAGQLPSSILGSSVGIVDATAFSTYWYGSNRWMSDFTPTVISLIGLPPGFYRDVSTAKPVKPDVYSDVIPYIQSKGIQKVSMPTGFDRLEKTDTNNLRVYMNYGAYSSLITIKISTELADTIVWQPQVANFQITSFPNFGDITDTKTGTITIQCVAGTGSAQVSFTKNPSDTPISVTPTIGTPILTAGQSHTLTFTLTNLGTPSTRDFSITASVKNSLGSVTDTATATGRVLEKTGATTIVHVVTEFEGEPISNLPVMIEYAGTSQTKTTGLDGLGTATFNLGTSSDVTVKASFAGNGIYKPASKTVSVSGGSEKTVTLALTKDDPATDDGWGLDWSLVVLVLGVSMIAVFGMYGLRRKR